MKKYQVDVLTGANYFGEGGEKIGTIYRVLEGRCIGNFNPLYCRYKNKSHLVKSYDGDLSDPFRRTENYRLFINL
jgi:hypothetical protein